MSKSEHIHHCIAQNFSQIHRERELRVPGLDCTAKGANPILRSGLYIIHTFTSTAAEQTIVLYWPEDTTWDDDAVSTVQRKRVMFMRYVSMINFASLLFQNNML